MWANPAYGILRVMEMDQVNGTEIPLMMDAALGRLMRHVCTIFNTFGYLTIKLQGQWFALASATLQFGFALCL